MKTAWKTCSPWLAVLLVVVACGAPVSRQTPTAVGDASSAKDIDSRLTAMIDQSTPVMDWSQPIRGGVVVTTFQDAQSNLPFAARIPRGLGGATLLISPRGEDGNTGRVVAFLYDTATSGRVLVIEAQDDSPVADFYAATARLVALSKNPASSVPVRGRFEAVTIRGNVQALLSTAADGHVTIEWREGERLIRISGPAITRNALMEIAEAA